MTRPKLLDLFCGAGGAGKGYHDAGFDVTGVDINPQPRYPFTFIQGDALEYVREHGHEYDAIHASPPCQHYSWSSRRAQREYGYSYPDMLEPTRKALEETGRPFVIENVTGAPLRNPVALTGPMFGLGVLRRRLFETNWPVLGHPHVKPHGSVRGGQYVTVAGHGGDGKASLHLWRDAMEIPWMDRKELTQAIPPAYTRFIGTQLMEDLT